MRDHPIILSYHRFVENQSDYRFSRTYDQFWHDMRKKEYDMITIDDAMRCQIKACAMLSEVGIRAKLFTCTSLVGTPGYCTWDELRKLSVDHDIENHSHLHEWHDKMGNEKAGTSIGVAQQWIMHEIGTLPQYFVAPYNKHTDFTDRICAVYKLTPLKNRVNILNISK